MIKGIGIDMCDIHEVERLLLLKDNAFINHTFTSNEIEISKGENNQALYFASIFASKEATFKALSSLQPTQFVDLRTIEILNLDVHIDSALMAELSIQNILISVTNDSHYAIAMAVIE